MMSATFEVKASDGSIVWKSKCLGGRKKASCNLSTDVSKTLTEKTQLIIIVLPTQTAGKEYNFYQRNYLYYVKNNHESKFVLEGMNSAWDLVVSQE